MVAECINPTAEVVRCYMCETFVKTCTDMNHPVCPLHKGIFKIADGEWLCSENCYNNFISEHFDKRDKK
jgi:nitrite reductase/ring-hydroxylating ferredoxin subunit